MSDWHTSKHLLCSCRTYMMVLRVDDGEVICVDLLLVVHVHFLFQKVFVVSSYVNPTFTYDVEVLSGQEDLMFPSFDNGRHASASGQSPPRSSRQWYTCLMSL